MKFRQNPRLAEELRAQPSHAAMLRFAAGEILRHAKASAPTGGTGYYSRSLRITDGRFKGREAGTGVRVESTDIAAHLIEFGSVKNPAYAPLRRGVRAAGLRLVEE